MYLVIFANIHITQYFDRRKCFQRFASQYWNKILNNKGNLTSWWEHYQFAPFSLMTLFYSQISVCVYSASILITSFVYNSIDTNIIHWYWVFLPNMCMYGGTNMPWVLMVTLCSTLSRKIILSHGGILYSFPDILHIKFVLSTWN